MGGRPRPADAVRPGLDKFDFALIARSEVTRKPPPAELDSQGVAGARAASQEVV